MLEGNPRRASQKPGFRAGTSPCCGTRSATSSYRSGAIRRAHSSPSPFPSSSSRSSARCSAALAGARISTACRPCSTTCRPSPRSLCWVPATASWRSCSRCGARTAYSSGCGRRRCPPGRTSWGCRALHHGQRGGRRAHRRRRPPVRCLPTRAPAITMRARPWCGQFLRANVAVATLIRNSEAARAVVQIVLFPLLLHFRHLHADSLRGAEPRFRRLAGAAVQPGRLLGPLQHSRPGLEEASACCSPGAPQERRRRPPLRCKEPRARSRHTDALGNACPSSQISAAAYRRCAMCPHRPPCPPADRPDRVPPFAVRFSPGREGWSLLCDGVIVFDRPGRAPARRAWFRHPAGPPPTRPSRRENVQGARAPLAREPARDRGPPVASSAGSPAWRASAWRPKEHPGGAASASADRGEPRRQRVIPPRRLRSARLTRQRGRARSAWSR